MQEGTMTAPERQTPAVQQKEKKRWSQKKIIITGVAGALAVILLVIIFFPSTSNALTAVVSEPATIGDITTTVVGSGSLDYGEKIDVLIPNGLKVNKVLVEDGDYVEVGDIIATFEPASVQTQIEAIEDELRDADADINSSKGAKVSSYVYANVSGRVKAIYAEVGDDTADVVAEHGALMILSIDGKMAVDFASDTKLSVGDKVKVILSDKTAKDGTVETVKNGNYTVTLSDADPDPGEKVTVETKEGSKLANGELYIHQPIAIYGSSGKIASINVSEGSYVYSGTAVVRMEDVSYSAEYQALLAKREELSATLSTLITISRTNSFVATFSGAVQTVNIKNGNTTASTSSAANAVGGSDSSDALAKYSGMSASNGSGEINYLGAAMNAEVTADTNNSIRLLQDTVTEITAADLTALSSLAPATGGTPKTSLQTTAFNGVVQWLPADTVFKSKTEYSAQITLIANAGYQFPAGFAPSLGQTVTVSNVSINTDAERNQLSFIAVFPETAEQSGAGDGETGGYGDLSGYGGYGGYSGSFGDMSGSGTTGGYSGNTAQTASESEYRMTGLVVASGDTMMLSIEIDELDILSVAKGQTAAITFDAIGGKTYEGVITKISNVSSSSGGSARYTASVMLDRDDAMRPGMNATAVISIGEKLGVVLLPVAAVQEANGREFVYLASDKDGVLSDERDIVTGLSDGKMVEIVEGLDEGEAVYYRYAASDNSRSGFGGMMGGGYGGGNWDDAGTFGGNA